jgi:hypothetical protein
VSDTDHESVAQAGEAFLDALDQSFDLWAEHAVSLAEARIGEQHAFTRAELVTEAERRLRADFLDQVAGIEASIERLRKP